MKPVACMKREYRIYSIIMIVCFIMGGFSLVFYLTQIYTGLWDNKILDDMRNNTNFRNDSNFSDFNRSFERFRNPPIGSFERFASPTSIITLMNGIVLIAGGISLWNITREKEITKAKEKITSMLLLPDEKIIMEELKKSGGESTQSLLVRKTGMNKVKVHRLVNRLAAKGIIKKYQYGLTNKIVLEKDV